MNSRTLAAFAVSFGLLCAFGAQAGPGHDHGGSVRPVADHALPQLSAVSERFELVAQLRPEELSILVDRRVTTEPVLSGSVTVELDGVSVATVFHADQGDFSLTDPDLLRKLSSPGEKTVNFLLSVGLEQETLSAVFDVHDESVGPIAEEHSELRHLAPWAVVAFVAVVALVAFVRRRSARRLASGGVA